jgi:aminoglycoside phosphotransferase (APT) family kinase protein
VTESRSTDSAPAAASEALVDPGALTAWADAGGHLSGEGPLEVDRLAAGHSNLTFVVRRASEPEREWILRRPPRGPLLPTAHDVVREYRVMRLLGESRRSEGGPAVRVPTVEAVCEDADVIGVPFYLMERVEGEVIRGELPDWLADDATSRSARRTLGLDLVDALAELHRAPYEPFVEAGIGKPDGYLSRQLRRWRGQREGIQKAFAERGETARELPDYDVLRDWLEANQPDGSLAGPPAVVHGDYKLDNVLVVPGDGAPRITAIVDWEMATVGDPLADLGYLLSFWPEPGEELPFSASGAVTASPGFPTRDEVIERYAERTGRRLDDVAFYMTLAVWKLAILLEASYARHLAGTTDDPFFALLDEGVPALLRRARGICGV